MSLSEEISRVVGGHNDTLKSVLVKLGISSASTAKADEMNALVANMNIPVGSGGTGKKTWTANCLIYPSAKTTMTQLANPTTAGSFLRQGTSGAPYWTIPADVAAAIGCAKIETGSYVGTGAAGSGSPTSISFGFNPQIVIIESVATGTSSNGASVDGPNFNAKSPLNWIMLVRGTTYADVKDGSESASNGALSITWGTNSVSFYHSVRSGYTPYDVGQLNKSGITYRYIALG